MTAVRSSEDHSVVLEARELTKRFTVRGGRGMGKRSVVAVDRVSLSLRRGEVLALVGESGSGKSTVARLLAQLEVPSSGELVLNGQKVNAHRGRRFRRYCSWVQIIFQDPFASLNPVHRIDYIIKRPLRLHRLLRSGPIEQHLEQLLADVQLVPSSQYLRRFPHELSGGQRQRVSIARALAARPAVLLADEPISMLDVSIRLGILNLLATLKTELDLAILYITHDIGSARYFADTILVMYAGELIEGGASEVVTQQPAHPYTVQLIAASPDPEDLEEGNGAGPSMVKGDVPSLGELPSGCRFHPRCPSAMARCSAEAPPRFDLGGGHWSACWLHQPRDEGRP